METDFDSEDWRKLPAPFDLFDASDAGRIRRSDTGRVMAHAIGPDGYCRIPLRLSTGGSRTVYVHRMVASVWCDGDQSLTVNHRNLVKHDNRAANLEWVTFAENHRHKYRERPELARAVSERVSKAIVGTDLAGIETRYASGAEAAIAMGARNRAGNICHAIQTGRVAYGCRWRFE